VKSRPVDNSATVQLHQKHAVENSAVFQKRIKLDKESSSNYYKSYPIDSSARFKIIQKSFSREFSLVKSHQVESSVHKSSCREFS